MDDKFFDFWGFDGGTITGTPQIWWKQIGYSDGGYTCDVNLDIDGNWFQTIYQDSNGYFSYYFDSTKYTNGSHTIGAIIRSTDGSEKYVTRSIYINNADSTPPIISEVAMKQEDGDILVTAKVTDNMTVDRVQYQAWLWNDPDDSFETLKVDAPIYIKKSSDYVWDKIYISDHNNAVNRLYRIDINVLDLAGNNTTERLSFYYDVKASSGNSQMP